MSDPLSDGTGRDASTGSWPVSSYALTVEEAEAILSKGRPAPGLSRREADLVGVIDVTADRTAPWSLSQQQVRHLAAYGDPPARRILMTALACDDPGAYALDPTALGDALLADLRQVLVPLGGQALRDPHVTNGVSHDFDTVVALLPCESLPLFADHHPGRRWVDVLTARMADFVSRVFDADLNDPE